jgi:hypothetical protein
MEKKYFGRILRGKSQNDFETLTDTQERKIVMLFDDFALKEIQDLKTIEILRILGYPKKFVSNLLINNYNFKLLIFEEYSNIKLATWDNIIELASEVHPEWKDRLEFSLPLLKEFSYEEILSQGGKLLEVREFLKDKMNFNNLFKGDGYIYTEDGNKSFKEYMMLNCSLSKLNNYIIKDLKI